MAFSMEGLSAFLADPAKMGPILDMLSDTAPPPDLAMTKQFGQQINAAILPKAQGPAPMQQSSLGGMLNPVAPQLGQPTGPGMVNLPGAPSQFDFSKTLMGQ